MGEEDQGEYYFMEHELTKDEKKHLRQEEWREKADRERKMGLLKTIGVWGLGLLLLAGALWALIAFSTGTTTSVSNDIKLPSITAKDYSSGSTSPSTSSGKIVTLVEYADFQCPACKAYYPVVKQLEKDFAGKMLFVYRFFPLKTVHKNAIDSAKAAYAAGLQGKFWEMHDMLFDTQDTWSGIVDPKDTFMGYAKTLGLNTDTFKKDYFSKEAEDFVNTSYEVATNMGLQSTPSFFVNGKLIDNPGGYPDFKALIEKAIGNRQ